METDRRGPARLRRSARYGSGHMPDRMPEAVRSGADLLILDLEDTVPVADTCGDVTVDYAMVTTARELPALAETIDAAVPGGEK